MEAEVPLACHWNAVSGGVDRDWFAEWLTRYEVLSGLKADEGLPA